MKLKFLLWIAAAVAALAIGVFVLIPKAEKTEETTAVVETPIEESSAPAVEETPVVSAEEVAAKEAEEDEEMSQTPPFHRYINPLAQFFPSYVCPPR